MILKVWATKAKNRQVLLHQTETFLPFKEHNQQNEKAIY